MKKLENRVYLRCFVSGFMGILFILYVSGLILNGGYSLVDGDLFEIYLPAIKNMYRDLLRGEYYLYSWNAGMGSNMALLYAAYTYSPFNALYLLDGLFSDITITTIIIAVRTGLSAVAICSYQRKVHDISDSVAMYFSVLYSLCAFQVSYNCINIMWLDALWILPLVFEKIYQITYENKGELSLTICYAYIFATNFYMGYIIGIVSFCFFGLNMWKLRGDKRTVVKKTVTYTIGVMAAIAISACVWIPALMNLLSNGVGNEANAGNVSINLMDVYNQLFVGEVGTLYNSGPGIYCGLIVLVLLPFYFKVGDKLKKTYMIMLAFMIAGCVFKPIYLLLHAFEKPNGWDYRFAYIISFLLCVIAAETFDKIETIHIRSTIGIVVCNALVYYFMMLWQENRKLDIRSNNNAYWIINIILIAVLSGLVYGYLRSGKRQIIMYGIILVSIGESIFAGYSYHYKREEVRPEIAMKLYLNWDESMDDMSEVAREFAKDERAVRRNGILANEGYLCDYSGLAFFSSSDNKKLRETLSKVGIWTTPRSVREYGLTPLTEMLFGVKYELYGPSYDEYIDGILYNQINMQELALPFGYVVDDDIVDVNLNSGNAFRNSNILVSAMTGEEVNVFQNIDGTDAEISLCGMEIYSDDEHIIFEDCFPGENYLRFSDFCMKKDEEVYAYWENDNSVSNSDSFGILGGDENQFYQNGLLSVSYIKKLGADENGKHLVVFSDGVTAVQSVNNIDFASIDYDSLKYAYNILSANSVETKCITNNYYSGRVTTGDEDILFFSIPYDKGWTLYVDSEKQEIIKLVNDTFIGALIHSEGEHIIELKYETPGLMIGLVISMAGIALLGIYAFAIKRVMHE